MNLLLSDPLYSFCSALVFTGGILLLSSALKESKQINEQIQNKKKEDQNERERKIRNFSKVGPSKSHPYQKKLDFYATNLRQGSSFCFDTIKEKENAYVYKICLTGGPHSGKNTSKGFLRDILMERGYKVYTVPLTSSLTMNNGGNEIVQNLDTEDLVKFQGYLIKLQMDMEDYFQNLAQLDSDKIVILCDRGCMDTQAFVLKEIWESILTENSWNTTSLRDNRYDAVIHLLTSADGAIEYFKKAENCSSEEELEEKIQKAKSIDHKLNEAYMGHPNYCIVDNSGPDFQSKINKVFGAVGKYIGLPVMNEFIRKFLVEPVVFPNTINLEEFHVTEIFLKKNQDNVERKIRKRGKHHAFTYLHSILIKNKQGYHHEVKKILSAREFNILLSQKDENLKALEKERKSFIWNHQVFILDVVKISETKTVNILRIDTQERNQSFQIPNFIKVSKEVTDDSDYSNYGLANLLSKEENN